MNFSKFFHVAGTVMLFTLAAHAQSFLTNGLAAYYPFNGNANDASGNGINGTVNGATLIPDRFGIANSAYSFNGTNNYISFATVPTTNVDDWTMTAWVQPASLPEFGIAVSIGYDDAVYGDGYSFGISGDPAGTSGSQLFALYGGISWYEQGFNFTSTSQWYQVVILRSAGVLSSYVNGVLISTGIGITPRVPTAFRIGSNNGYNYFNGSIDDVRIYNRALSSTEVAQLYTYEGGRGVYPVSFILSSTNAVGNGPTSIVAVDVNGDGYLDLVSANLHDNTLTVLTNNGNRVFGYNATYSVGVEPVSVVAADVSGDGKVDLICANRTGNTLNVLTNNGSGVFGSNATYVVGYTYSAIAADVNGDGKLDLICANFQANTLSIYTNDGKGGFALSSTPSVGSAGPVCIVAADVNGDGSVDLVTANFYGNNLSVLTNDGSGGFVLASIVPAGNTPRWVAAADLNGDGKVDLVCANTFGNNLMVFTNNGNGGFALASTLPTGNNPYSVVATDVNGDGLVDLVVDNSGDNTLSVFTNTRSGTFVSAELLFPLGHGPTQIAAGDFNGDGKVDLASADSVGNTITILTNATLFPQPSPPVIESQPASIVVPAFGSASFQVVASGSPPPTYQWTFDGTNLPGTTSNLLTISNVDIPNLGNYQVFVSNYFGSTNSEIVTLNMSPSLISPFNGATLMWGKAAALSVDALGSGQLTYQWYKDGVVIPGANGDMLNFTSTDFTNAGLYYVVVSSAFGSVTNTQEQVVVNVAGVSLGFSPTLTIIGVPGFVYNIQSSTNLANTNAWVTLTNLTLTQPVELWVDTNVDASSPFNPKTFYKVSPGQ
jgi:hypothetical protein